MTDRDAVARLRALCGGPRDGALLRVSLANALIAAGDRSDAVAELRRATEFDADYSAFRQILERMKQGGLLVIAPEGTRSKTEALQEGKMGVAFLASKSGYPVLPVAVTGTEDRGIMENLKHFRRSKITATAADPLHIDIPKGAGREEAMRRATDEIMCQIGALLPEKYRGVYVNHPRLKELLKN